MRSSILDEVEKLASDGAAECAEMQEKEQAIQLQISTLHRDIADFKAAAVVKVLFKV